MWIGLCGQSGAGKGYIAALFAKKGIPSIDTDRVYRDLTGSASPKTPCMEALCAAFGSDVANKDGSLNRAYLRSRVFGAENHEQLALLNQITHRFILAETEARADSLTRDGAKFVLIDAPLLYESGFDKRCVAVICVTAPLEVRLSRIEKRDGINREAAMARIRTQISEEILRKRVDYEICNDEKTDLEEQVEKILVSLRERFYSADGRVQTAISQEGQTGLHHEI